MRYINSALWQIGRLYLSWSKQSKVITVLEYPKGGGTWIGKLLATSLDIPFVGGGPYLPLIPSVIRTHWQASTSVSPCVIVVRDPRDVMVSLFHHRIKNLDRTPKRRQQFEALFTGGLSADKIAEQMPEFIRIEFEDPRYGARSNWTDFIDQALQVVESSSGTRNTIFLMKYEDMLSEPEKTLKLILSNLGFTIADELISCAVRLNDKSWGTKNFLDNSSQSTFVRSGVSGEWQTVMNEDSRRIMSEYCGHRLVALGYETTPDWWRQTN